MHNKDNTGALFSNKKKREGKKDADYQGQITINGVGFWLNAWINTSTDGKTKYMALKAEPKTPSRTVQPEPVIPQIDLDSEIPF